MLSTRHNTAHLLVLALTVGLLALALLAPACGPAAPSEQAGDAVEATPTSTATPDSNQKLDITMAGLVARHKAATQGASGAVRALTDPLLAEPTDTFIRVSRDIDNTRSFLETNGATVSVVRGSGDGYILAQVPVSLIERVAKRSEVTDVSSGVVAYMDQLVKISIAHHEAGNGAGEKILVHLEVPFTYNNYFLGLDKGVEAVAANLGKLRVYLSGHQGVEVTQDSGAGGNYIRAQVPLGLLRELSEMPFVDAIMADDPSVPGLTLAEGSKIIHLQIAEIMAAHVAGVALPDDPNFVNSRMIRVVDGTVRIAIRITGEDAATDATNGRVIIDFLTENGGGGKLKNDRLVGPYVWGVVPVPALVPLVKLPEVQNIYITPPEVGPVPSLSGPAPQDGRPRGAAQDDAPNSGVATAAEVTTAGRDRHGAKAWHDASITGASGWATSFWPTGTAAKSSPARTKRPW